MWPINLSVRLPIVDLVGLYPTNYLIGREPISKRISPLIQKACALRILCGISSGFPELFPSLSQVAHALLTRPPLSYFSASWNVKPFDLHVLGTPPAFVLSQDQTLWNMVYIFILHLYDEDIYLIPEKLQALLITFALHIFTKKIRKTNSLWCYFRPLFNLQGTTCRPINRSA